MNINKMLAEKNMVSPCGTAYWAKVNSEIDDNNGKLTYQIALHFEPETEAKMKKLCDDLLAKAKGMKEFEGKTWMREPYMPYYTDKKNGQLMFKFRTSAFYKKRSTGEEVQKYIPVFVAIGDTQTCKKLGRDKSIGNGSEATVQFMPGAFWSAANSNGLNFYLNEVMVKKLVEYNGADGDPSGFGYTLVDDDAEPMSAAYDEEVPI